MSASRKRRTRRQRRANKAALKFGPSAKPRHTSKSGRTGHVRAKHLRSRNVDRNRPEEAPHDRP